MSNVTCSVPECEQFHHSASYCKRHYTQWKRYGDPLVQINKKRQPTGRPACSIDGCDKEQHSSGLCPMHYQRKRIHGSTVLTTVSLEERFLAKVNKTDSCWLWEAATDSKGYGQISTTPKPDGSYVREQAHRVSYELFVGPIPEGLHIDHICHVVRCVNPEHLRPVTVKENLEHRAGAARHSKSGVRGVSWCASLRKWRAAMTHHQQHVYVGYYSTIAEAEAAVIAKRNELFTHNDLDRAA